MIAFDWPAIFSLAAHELRSPASVIAGCARMLREGRLSPEDQQRVYGQIERAAARVTGMCEQASDLGRWLRPEIAAQPSTPVPPEALIRSAVARSPAGPRVTAGTPGSEAANLDLFVLSRDALVAALASLLDLVGREEPDAPLGITFHVDQDRTWCDILIGPYDVLADLPAARRKDALANQLSVEAGGMGLALVVCAAVVAAHEGQLLTFADQRTVVGMRLRADRES